LLDGIVFKQLIDTTSRLDFFSETGAGVGIEIGIGVIEAIVIVGSDCKVGFGIGTIFKELSDIIGRIEDFFSKAGVEAGAGIGTAIGVFGTIGIVGILEIAGVIVGAVETGAASDAGSSCARHGKIVS
jgi:hypothetical protein